MISETITSGSLVLALLLAFVAGIVSFLSPCVLPLVPGYLSYLTGLTGAEAAAVVAGTQQRPRRSLAALSALGFVAGFTVVFVSYGVLFGALGGWLAEYSEAISRVLGVLVILLGLAFMGVLPILQRDVRVHSWPRWGPWASPLLGLLFGLGWTPCIGPTLAAVQSLAFTEGSAARGALLSLGYCLGLGVPFLLFAVLFERMALATNWVKAHYRALMIVGGGLLVLIGVALVTGWWTDFTIAIRGWISGFTPPV